jgi:hypothetical protein
MEQLAATADEVSNKGNFATQNKFSRFGSIPAAEFSDRHGRTCFNTGRQGTQPQCILLIDEMTAST